MRTSFTADIYLGFFITFLTTVMYQALVHFVALDVIILCVSNQTQVLTKEPFPYIEIHTLLFLNVSCIFM